MKFYLVTLFCVVVALIDGTFFTVLSYNAVDSYFFCLFWMGIYSGMNVAFGWYLQSLFKK